MVTIGQIIYHRKGKNSIITKTEEEGFFAKPCAVVYADNGKRKDDPEYKIREGAIEKHYGYDEEGRTYFLSREESLCGIVNNSENEKLSTDQDDEEKKLERLRIIEIKGHFKSKYRMDGDSPFELDFEQAKAIATKEKNILVSARAGSGKTRVIVGKVLYLIDVNKIPTSAIRVLAFNRNAVDEIKDRFDSVLIKTSEKWNKLNIDVTKTFHQLAYDIVQPRSKILEDKTKLIRIVVEELKGNDKDFCQEIYDIFRKESASVDRDGFANEQDYYEYIKNSSYQTLKGGRVKSIGEKWIADFLFENGVDYIYEREYYTNKIGEGVLIGDDNKRAERIDFLYKNSRVIKDKKYRKSVKPDFYLPEYELVWEHWGIDEKEKDSEEKERFSRKFDLSWKEYYDLMKWKREFWGDWRKNELSNVSNDENIKRIKMVRGLIETSVAQMKKGRDSFESVLAKTLEKKGVNINKLPIESIIEEVWKKEENDFCKLMKQFVDKYQQHYFDMSDSDIERKIEEYKNKDEREYAFLKLGLKVLKRYEEVLTADRKPNMYSEYEPYRLDFNQLVLKATREIKAGKIDDEVLTWKYLLIDEYQDFSELFYSMIAAIKERNPEISLFCVGDCWQAINRFMGADTTYFEDFAQHFSNTSLVDITNNYRSEKKLVEFSNRFMNDRGFREKPSRPVLAKNNCVIEKIDMTKEWLEGRTQEEGTFEYNRDKKYVDFFYDPIKRDANKNTNSFATPKYIRRTLEIIKGNKGKTILILHRINKFDNKHELSEVENRIRKFCKNKFAFSDADTKKVSVETMHRAKGVEADVVVILEANKKCIPYIHPDSNLFSLFGETPTRTLLDETKLYYVAITRAKSELYILYEEEKKSGFLSEYQPNFEN